MNKKFLHLRVAWKKERNFGDMIGKVSGHLLCNTLIQSMHILIFYTNKWINKLWLFMLYLLFTCKIFNDSKQIIQCNILH